MATFTDEVRIIFNAATGNAKKAIGEAGVAAETTGKQSLLAQAKMALLGKSADGTAKQMSGLTKAAVGVATIAAVGKIAYGLAGSFADATSSVRAFQRVSGTTAEDASRLTFAMKTLGINTDSGSTAIARLEVNIGKGKLGEYADLVKRTSDGSVDLTGTLSNVADAYQHTADQSQKAALAQTLFGRGYKELLPLLSKTKGELADIYSLAAKQGQIFSQADLESGRQFTLSMHEFKTALQGVEIQLGKIAAPALTQLNHGLTTLVDTANTVSGPLGGISGVAKFAFDVSPIGNFNNAVAGVSDLVNGDLGSGLEHIGKSIPIIGNIASGVEDLFGGGGDAAVTFADKQQQAADALTRVRDLQAQGKQGTDEYKAAMKEAQAATGELDKSQQQLATAFQTAGQKAAIAAQNELSVWSAQLQAANSAQQVKQAQDAYNQALQDHGAISPEATQAERDYEAAVLNSAVAAGQLAVQQSGETDKTKQAEIAHRAEIKALEFMANTTSGPVHAAILEHLRVLGLIPGDKGTFIHVDGIEAALQRLGALQAVLNAYGAQVNNIDIPQPGAPGGYPSQPPPRAGGGPVMAGTMYRVNERGQEFFTPSVNGRITPAGQWGGGSTIVVNVAGSVVTEKQLTRNIAENLRRLKNRSGDQG